MEQTGKRKKKKGIITAVVIVLLLGGGAVGITSCMKSMTDAMNTLSTSSLEIVKAEKRDISNVISVSGTVESENIVKVTSKLTAKIKTLNVEVGSHVNAGDVLCVFDSTDLQQQYDNLSKNQNNSQNQTENQHKINLRNLETAKQDKEINLQQAQRAIDDAIQAQNDIYAKEAKTVDELNAQLERRDNAQNTMNSTDDPTEYQKAMQTYQEADALVQSKEAALDSIRDQFSTYEKAVQSAQDAYASAERAADAAIQSYQDVLDAEQYQQNNDAQTELDKLADSIAECTVKAPKSGIITSLNVSEGSIPTTDALMTIEDSGALKITVQINEADILNIHEGQPAVVKTNATGDKEFEAEVSRVVNIYNAGTADALTGTSSAGGYSAEITMKDSENLLIGMNAKVKIILDEKKDVLAVPYESIVTKDDDSKYVLTVVRNSDGTATAKAVTVETGMEGSYYTEITSGSLTENTEIVMTPGDYQDGETLPIFDMGTAVQGAKANE
ncbi:MAG: HlyD family efflux transporter periplasmic adaptor subunit [Ruminococcus sp.]|nr:HlyD family efflux transporter periplasmic adaptor subunit [Ruminococcus sp.]